MDFMYSLLRQTFTIVDKSTVDDDFAVGFDMLDFFTYRIQLQVPTNSTTHN